MRKKLSLNYHIQYNVLVLLLISITLVSSTSIVLPLGYSQEIAYILGWSQLGEGQARLSQPSGIAVNSSSGNVYVADTANNRIQVFSDNGTFISNFGRYGRVNGSLSFPEAIAVDSSSGNVYVADTGNNRIKVFSSNGTFITEWGQYGGRSGNGTLKSPQGIAVDSSSGNVYVADTANNRIQVFSDNGTFLAKWGRFAHGAGNYTFNHPTGIAVDQEGNVYVADTANNRIQVFSDNGTFISNFGRYGRVNGSLSFPEAIAVDQEGNVYVADTGNNRIQVFSSNGTFLAKWGSYGRNEEQMRSPQGIAVDQQGNIYVADTANNRISAISPFATVDISNVAFSSEEGEIYGNNTRIKIEPIYDGLTRPTAIAFLGPDDMLVTENNTTIMRIVNGQMLDEPVLDLGNSTRILSCICDIEILRNDNNVTSYAFVYYAKAEVTEDDGEKIVNRLYRYDITNGKFTNPNLIFEMPSSLNALHNGGKLMVGPDKNIYLTTGDIDGQKTKAQNVKDGPMPDGSSGILRFTPNGDPVDGGLLGDTHPLDKYYAYGIRNSFGIDYDPVTDNIWITDNGPRFGDELNIVRPGFNGGWDKIIGFSYLHESFNKRSLNLTDLEFFNGTGKYYEPTFEWFDSLGITDLVFVPSDKLGNEYEGNLFVGDYNFGYLYRFVLNQTRTGLLLNGSLSDGVASNNIERLEAVFAKINGGGITHLEVGPDGLVYIVSYGGKITRLEPIDTNATLPVIETTTTNVTDTAPVGINGTDIEATDIEATDIEATDIEATDTGAATETGATGDSDATGVSIVPGSTTLTDDVYQPNPVEVSVGDTVTWTNDDPTPHTVTSGAAAQPDGIFDSGIIVQQETFEHTFTEAGEYPYYCALHPNMVGTVSVS